MNACFNSNSAAHLTGWVFAFICPAGQLHASAECACSGPWTCQAGFQTGKSVMVSKVRWIILFLFFVAADVSFSWTGTMLFFAALLFYLCKCPQQFASAKGHVSLVQGHANEVCCLPYMRQLIGTSTCASTLYCKTSLLLSHQVQPIPPGAVAAWPEAGRQWHPGGPGANHTGLTASAGQEDRDRCGQHMWDVLTAHHVTGRRSVWEPDAAQTQDQSGISFANSSRYSS